VLCVVGVGAWGVCARWPLRSKKERGRSSARNPERTNNCRPAA